MIQFHPDELNYVNAKLHPLAGRCGSFLRAFLVACLRADSYNYEIIRPALLKIMQKYPPDPLRIAMEQHDNGMEHEPLDPLLDREFALLEFGTSFEDDKAIQPTENDLKNGDGLAARRPLHLE